ncbi:hypothetical protein MTR_3g097490 [Medicago truncatula]|uniref:Uncharacterized protein n=1 Tax=Medicago truncatula TaxID=3880 RepID=A0A072VBV7_MEDTR|nr:hypothetical protein MTR_3g097490 [Medicago truncatula]
MNNRKAMKHALSFKNKNQFINGSFPRPPSSRSLESLSGKVVEFTDSTNLGSHMVSLTCFKSPRYFNIQNEKEKENMD